MPKMKNSNKMHSLYFFTKRTNAIIKWTGIITYFCNLKLYS